MNKWFKGDLVASLVVSSQFQTDVFASEASLQAAQPDWYFQLDVNALKNSSLAAKVAAEKADAFGLLTAVVGEKLINDVNYVMVQGSAEENEDKMVLLKGDFLRHQSVLIDKWKELGLTNKTSFNGQTIYHGPLKDLVLKIKETHDKMPVNIDDEQVEIEISKAGDFDDIDNTVYTALRADNSIIMSDKLANVKYWLSDDTEWKPSEQGGVFEVVVDIEKSLVHGGVNIDEASENFQFESISAKQLSQVSVTYSEDASDAEVQIGLRAEDMETASKIKSVAHGLIALMTLSNSDREINSILASIQFEQDGENLLFKVTGPIETLKTLLDKHVLNH